MKTRTTLYADKGMILTDGEHFGTVVHLEVGADSSPWHEITDKEYQEILARLEEEPLC